MSGIASSLLQIVTLRLRIIRIIFFKYVVSWENLRYLSDVISSSEFLDEIVYLIKIFFPENPKNRILSKIQKMVGFAESSITCRRKTY